MKNPNAPTLENIIKMLVGAFAGFGAIASGYYFAYLVVVYTQTF